jgi:16S rRNA processing protein RimM
LTIKVGGGDAAIWERMSRFSIARPDGTAEVLETERIRSYRDRLVVKFRGVDDAGSAAALRGANVQGTVEDAPELPAGEHYSAVLVGMEVVDEAGRRLGEVDDLAPTGGADLLRVASGTAGDDELLIPMVKEIVLEIDESDRRITVRLPVGLEELNR